MGLFNLKISQHRRVGVFGFILMIFVSICASIYNSAKIYFEPKVLVHKYCFLEVGRDTSLIPMNIMTSNDKRTIDEIYNYYLKIKNANNARNY